MIQVSTRPDQTQTFSNRKRWTRTDCAFLECVGLLTERYELLDGEIILKVGHNQPHAITVSSTIFYLMGVFGPTRVQTQTTIDAVAADRETSQPQPDVMVFARPAHELTAKPTLQDLLLIAEVSDSTLHDDMVTKAALYARNGVPEYCVMDVQSRRLIAHRSPADAAYSEIVAYSESETIAPQVAPEQTIRLGELLPPMMATGT